MKIFDIRICVAVNVSANNESIDILDWQPHNNRTAGTSAGTENI